MAQRQNVSIKVECKGVIRLLNIAKDLPYNDFCQMIANTFNVSDCQLQYSDEEGDLVQLGSQVINAQRRSQRVELQEALKVAERFGPLKVTIRTREKPSMNPDYIKPPSSDVIVADSPAVPLGQQVNFAQSRSTPHTSSSPNTLIDPLANLQLNEKRGHPVKSSTRQSRKRMGFYASLCNEVVALELGAPSPGVSNNECSQTNEKPKKKPKHQKEGNYYSSLAEDVAAMKLVQGTARDTKMKNSIPKKRKVKYSSLAQDVRAMNLLHGHSSEEELSSEQLMVGGTRVIPEGQDMKAPEEDMDDEPPAWFNKALDKMSHSVSKQVLGALNGAVIASIPTVNGHPMQPIKRDGASYIHDGITCDGCHQTIIGSRYKCGNCPDYDLCEQCEAIEGIHSSSHVFLKLRFPSSGIGRKHGVMIPLLKDLIYKSKNSELAEEQERTMKEVRKKLKQIAKKKREEQVRLKKGERKMKKFKGSSNPDGAACDLELVFLGDGSYPDGTAVGPESEFTKCWKIRNGGNVAWTNESKLICMYGAIRSMAHEVDLPCLKPGEEGTVEVKFVAPQEAGQYFSVWRASHGGKNFGSKIWCKIKVVLEDNQSDDDEAFVDANEVPSPTFTAVAQPEETSCRSENTQQELEETPPPETEQTPYDDMVNFHGYTVVDNTDDPPPRLADVVSSPSFAEYELEWDTCLMDNDESIPDVEESIPDVEEGFPFEINEEHNDDLLDIEVISTASSDEFCVVPLPPCFNPDIPLNIEAMDPQDSLGSQEEDETSVTTIPESAAESEVDELRERNLAEFTQSTPVPIKMAKKVVDTVIESGVQDAALCIDSSTTATVSSSFPKFEMKIISKPVAPHPPCLERSPFMPGRLPASPPGRAVPVVQPSTTYAEPPTRVAIFHPPSYSSRPDNDVINDAQDDTQDDTSETVRTQPPEGVVNSRSISESAVTSQPSSAQRTAQFATTFVSGTLASAKRAFGSVTDTVTTFMSGGDGNVAVAYNQQENNVHVVVPELTETVEPHRASPEPQAKSDMEQLIEMGFFDRALNERLLRKYNDDVSKVVTELLHASDNDWSSRRHVAN